MMNTLSFFFVMGLMSFLPSQLDAQEVDEDDIQAILFTLKSELKERNAVSLDTASLHEALEEGFRISFADDVIWEVFHDMHLGPLWRFLACDFGGCWMRYPGMHVETRLVTRAGDQVRVILKMTGGASGATDPMAPVETQLNILLEREGRRWQVKESTLGTEHVESTVSSKRCMDFALGALGLSSSCAGPRTAPQTPVPSPTPWSLQTVFFPN